MNQSAISPPERPATKPPFAARLWTYQAERFPVFRHGALIAAFGASAVCLSALLRGGDGADLYAILVAVLVLFGFFFQLRVADEHKDFEDDAKYRPERAVPRGLVTLGELRIVAAVVAVVQVALSISLDGRLLALLMLVWAWMALMTKEFFVPKWLKARPIAYMVSHMAVMPLIDLYATGADWVPENVDPKSSPGLIAFLGLSLVNGVVIEIARKCWAPEQEREGVETYSKLWKPQTAGLSVAAAMFVGLVLSAYVHVESDAHIGFLVALMLATFYGMWAAIVYATGPTPGASKGLETASGVFVLANYLLLGVLPMAEHLWLK